MNNVTAERAETALQVQVLTQQERGVGFLFGGQVQMVVVNDDQLQRAWEKARRKWLSVVRQESANTARAYDVAVNQFWEWSPVPPWMVTTAIVLDWRLYARSDGYVRSWDELGRPLTFGALSKSSVNQKLSAMASFYDFVAYEHRYPIPPGISLDEQPYIYDTRDGQFALWPVERGNPFNSKSIRRFRVSPYGRAQFPTTDELQAILWAINTDCRRGRRDFAVLFTAATTCRRFSEFIGLRWGDLHEMEDGDFWFPYRYKGGDERKAVLNRIAYQAICDYLRADGRLEAMGEGDYVFVPLDPGRIRRMCPDLDVEPNRPIGNGTANGILKKCARWANVDEGKAHIHGLRHAGLRLRVQQMKENGGVDYVEVMELAGHSTLAVTQIYVQEVCEDPEDRGGQAAAMALLPKGSRRRRTEPAAEQGRLL